MREILGIFKEPEVILRVCVMFINRIVDMWNEKVFRVRFQDPEVFQNICNKVGFCTFFPFMQPEQVKLTLDFKYHDQRLAFHSLLLLACKERRENIFDFSLTDYPAGNPLFAGIPVLWERFEQIPKEGILTCFYKCSPQDRKVQVRKHLFQQLGFWTMDADVDVMWWADVAQTPADVILFLCFIANVTEEEPPHRRRFESVDATFKFIDECNEKRGVLILRDFEEGVEAMGFKKFDDRPLSSSHRRTLDRKTLVDRKTVVQTPQVVDAPIKKDRIQRVFRYLDSNHDSFVAPEEFGVLTLLWNEVSLSIREFVKFLQRTHGDDLDEIWEYFMTWVRSSNGGEDCEIDEQTWYEITSALEYFGPVGPIFHFMDLDGQAGISRDEFFMLSEYLDPSTKYR
jgi:hypothetical protein